MRNGWRCLENLRSIHIGLNENSDARTYVYNTIGRSSDRPIIMLLNLIFSQTHQLSCWLAQQPELMSKDPS